MKNDNQPRTGAQPIRIMGFVDGDMIPPACYDRPYRLEADRKDGPAYEVLREVMQPAFRAGQFAAGIDRAFELLMAKAEGIAVGPARATRVEKGAGFVPMVVLWYLPLAGYFLVVSVWARKNAFLWAVLPWVAILIIEGLIMRSHHFADCS